MPLNIILYLNSLKILCPEKEVRFLWHKLEVNLHCHVEK